MELADYDLELDKVAERIKKQKARRILIQLPDGLKPKAAEIADFLESKTKAGILIWFGSCFGACDVPAAQAEKLGVDLIVQFGHSKFAL